MIDSPTYDGTSRNLAESQPLRSVLSTMNGAAGTHPSLKPGASCGVAVVTFPLWFRLFIIMIRTEDKMNINVGESQPLPWFLSCSIRTITFGQLRPAAWPPTATQ
eukprot:COSAG01_NODE_4403_length_5060_cov_15.005644_1_plen_105_part_00